MRDYDIEFVTSKNGDAAYRLRPNPDAPPGDGYNSGAVLEHRDIRALGNWHNYFFIAPEDLGSLSRMLAEADKERSNT